jgi:hypothetical protein
MKGLGEILVAGLVSIGLATALFKPGRTTVAGIKAGGDALNSAFKTVIG